MSTRTADEQIRQVYVEVRVLESYAEEIRTRLQVVLTTSSELQTTRTAVEALSNTTENTPLLVNLGGGVYSIAKLADPEKILIDVGTGVVVEKAVADSLEIVNKRLADLDKARASLESQLSNVLMRLDKSRTRLSELSTPSKESRSRSRR